MYFLEYWVYFSSSRIHNSFNSVVKVDAFEALHDQEYLYFILIFNFSKFPPFIILRPTLLFKHFFSGVIRPVFFVFDFFFFNYALLFVSLGSIITHFIHLLPTHSTAMLFLKERLCFLPRPCSFSRAASEIIWLLKWRVGKGGRLQGPQLKAALAFFDIYGQPDYDD